MEFKHNKKRNIGLISEFFSRYIAEAFIDERHDDIAKARQLWEKHVHPKSATYTELQVFNALHESNLKSKEIAFSMLEKAKAVCKKQSQLKLDEEKYYVGKSNNVKKRYKEHITGNGSAWTRMYKPISIHKIIDIVIILIC